jgi:hypothetical protein
MFSENEILLSGLAVRFYAACRGEREQRSSAKFTIIGHAHLHLR